MKDVVTNRQYLTGCDCSILQRTLTIPVVWSVSSPTDSQNRYTGWHTHARVKAFVIQWYRNDWPHHVSVTSKGTWKSRSHARNPDEDQGILVVLGKLRQLLRVAMSRVDRDLISHANCVENAGESRLLQDLGVTLAAQYYLNIGRHLGHYALLQMSRIDLQKRP